MRKANAEEKKWYAEELTPYHVTVRFKDPRNPNKKPEKRMGPFYGTPEQIKPKALEEAMKRWNYATDFTVDEELEEGIPENDRVFHWDWKEMSDVEDFYKQLDKQLKPYNLEVVEFPFDGGMYVWFVGPRK